jgi:hypothetical protein
MDVFEMALWFLINMNKIQIYPNSWLGKRKFRENSRARICKYFTEPQESIASLAGPYDNPIYRTGLPVYCT